MASGWVQVGAGNPGGASVRPYLGIRHPDRAELGTYPCYLCGFALTGTIDPDHIIPQSMFEKDSRDRPALLVHERCNKRKAREDQWFGHVINFMCAVTSATAERKAMEFLLRAQDEAQDAYLPGRDVRNYVLARTLLGGAPTPKLQVTYGGRVVPQQGISRENTARLRGYIQRLTFGLYVRNIPEARPSLPEVTWVQYAQVEITGVGRDVQIQVIDLFRKALASRTAFAQSWGDSLRYTGGFATEDRSKGFIYIEFFSAAGFLALFM